MTELIRKRPAKLDVPQEHRALANALVLASTESVKDKPTSHRRPQARSAQLARVAGLGLAACVLCGSVTLAAVITSHRDQTAAPANHKLEITGEQALLPDSFTTIANQTPAPIKPEVPGQVQDTATGSFPYTPGSTSTTPAPAKVERHQPKASSAVQLVREFYELIATDPAQAFLLLAPEAFDADFTRFVEAWSSVTDVRVVEMREQKDGSVISVVSMRMADGSRLRLEQLLRTGGGGELRIVGAELLSAQHG
ncbi:hypothetical protein [Labedaea rhizosphaerae]|uniref:hypothetical protein n=1 Tax=Labedaea rhizosphaerae TaxID=598644 RepID=UPI0010607765|nr:hypothetical protein [Labedaea rhizosphaerae]